MTDRATQQKLENRLPISTLLVYTIPTLGVGYMFFLITMYLMKFSTDVLYITPATMGLIFGLSRIWDAVTDPVVGYATDRTRLPMGRRRPWILAAVFPICIAFYMLWNPPASFSGTSLVIWMAVSVFLFYTAMSAFNIPHKSLGAELSHNYHERTHIFGIRHIIWGAGAFAAIGGMWLLIAAEDPRNQAFYLTISVCIISAALMILMVAGIRERTEYMGRGEANPFKAYRDVFRNPHARLLLIVYLIESLGAASIGVLMPYVSEYIIGSPEYTPFYALLYTLPYALSAPLWIILSKRFGKKNLWIFSMSISSIGFGSMFFVHEGSFLLVCVLAVILGFGAGSGAVVGPSIKADVIDYDEYLTGQRKEGSYFAAWNFVLKSSTGISVMLTGFVLSATGFVPNIDQTEGVKLALRILFAIFPCVCYIIGAIIFSRFTLNETEYARIRKEIDARSANNTSRD